MSGFRYRFLAVAAPLVLMASSALALQYYYDAIDECCLPLDGMYSPIGTGSGYTVWILGTGINALHNEFGGRAQQVANFAGGPNLDEDGEGTWMASLVGGSMYGMAPGVQLRGVKVCRDGSCPDVVSGIAYIQDNADHGSVAVLSRYIQDGSISLDIAIANLVNSGVPVVVPAGDEAVDACNNSPSGAPSAITVGAHDQFFTRPGWSAYGPCIDIYAPGENVTALSTFGGGAATLSTTSASAAIVAGALTILGNETSALMNAACPVAALAGPRVNVGGGVSATDSDADGYCLPNDCDDANPNCTSDCTDADTDGFCVTTDCDDNAPLNFPGNPEVCDNQDNNCDTIGDDGFDGDGDGVTSCDLPAPDCDNSDPLNFPGNPETCDNQDNNCDTTIDEGFDGDGDGVTTCDLPAPDCDDNDPLLGLCNTPLSSTPVTVTDPPGNASIEFPDVATPGDTTFMEIPCSINVPDGFTLNTGPNCYRVETTADSSTGEKIVCVRYSDSLDPAPTHMFKCESAGAMNCCAIPLFGGPTSCPPGTPPPFPTFESLTTIPPDQLEACINTFDLSDFAFGQLDNFTDSDFDTVSDVEDNCPSTFNPLQEDIDFDGAGDECDCAASDPTIHPGALEINDGVDNQCPGDAGYGVIDELAGPVGFFNPADRDEMSWQAQPFATMYDVGRSASALFDAGCVTFYTAGTSEIDRDIPLEGELFHYLVRPVAPAVGSWGQNSAGTERVTTCP